MRASTGTRIEKECEQAQVQGLLMKARRSLWAADEDFCHSPGHRRIGCLQPAHDDAVGLPVQRLLHVPLVQAMLVQAQRCCWQDVRPQQAPLVEVCHLQQVERCHYFFLMGPCFPMDVEFDTSPATSSQFLRRSRCNKLDKVSLMRPAVHVQTPVENQEGLVHLGLSSHMT